MGGNLVEIRSPKSTDIFTIIRILGKLKIKNDVVSMSSKIALMNNKNKKLKSAKGKEKEQLENEVGELQTELGVNLPFILLENIDKAQDDVEKLFADLVGMSVQEYQDSDADLTVDIFYKIQSDKKWMNLFTKALRLFQR